MFGAYTDHLAALSEDSFVKSAGCAKISGYYKKWLDANYILGCAVCDLLTPCTIFSKCMPYDEDDILGGIYDLSAKKSEGS